MSTGGQAGTHAHRRMELEVQFIHVAFSPRLMNAVDHELPFNSHNKEGNDA
jgi:hypothetical protein